MLSVNDTDPVQPPAAVAVIVSGNAPACVGVPSSTPAAEKFIPVGSVPDVMLHVIGGVPPVCVNVTGDRRA